MAGAPWSAARPHSAGPRCRLPICAPALHWCLQGWPHRVRPSSIACITSTVATSGSKRNFVLWEQKSSVSSTDPGSKLPGKPFPADKITQAKGVIRARHRLSGNLLTRLCQAQIVFQPREPSISARKLPRYLDGRRPADYVLLLNGQFRRHSNHGNRLVPCRDKAAGFFLGHIRKALVPVHAVFHELTDLFMRLGERNSLANQRIGYLRSGKKTLGRRSFHSVRMNSQGLHHAPGKDQAAGCRVHSVEKSLLVFLQIAVIGKRQALQLHQLAREPTRHSRSLPTDQFQSVRVLFLRHQAAAGCVSIIKFNKAKRRRRIDNQVLGEAAEMNQNERACKQHVADKIAVGSDVQTVAGRASEPKLAR